MQITKWLLAMFCAAGLWMALVPAGMAEEYEVPEANPYSGDKKAIRSGRSWYRNVCSPCHGGRADGQGERGTGADLRKQKLGYKGFVEVVLDGRKVQGRIQFMPGWRNVLSMKDILEITAYVETLALPEANWE
ncbi:MAG: hypothetical protein AMJ66_03970 [Betaproteobacteria bacterium SG8_40]|nr:MAG: hypothetical protein AMJ66_03970 [Betaproteobacteria bacterium SG8_40]